MFTSRILSTLILLLISVLSITAQKTIPVDSTHLLSKEQKKAIKYTKKNICSDDSSMELPLEVNMIFGDTISKKHYYVTPCWEESYFLPSDSVVLIVPLRNDSLNLLQCQLRVENPNPQKNRYFNQVETLIGEYDEVKDEFNGYIVYSSNEGNFIEIDIFRNGTCVEIVKNKLMDWGNAPIFAKSNNKSKRFHNIINGDWRKDYSRGFHRGYEGDFKLQK